MLRARGKCVLTPLSQEPSLSLPLFLFSFREIQTVGKRKYQASLAVFFSGQQTTWDRKGYRISVLSFATHCVFPLLLFLNKKGLRWAIFGKQYLPVYLLGGGKFLFFGKKRRELRTHCCAHSFPRKKGKIDASCWESRGRTRQTVNRLTDYWTSIVS